MPHQSKIGLAFSGGGIRSAALSSGVLRRLLHRGVKADYISCVSGGSITAAAYVDWKYRNHKEDHPKWHKEFFEHMRSNAGYICNWHNGWKGILDSLILTLLLLVVNIVIPFAVWGSFSIPLAFMVDIVFGDIMCTGYNCTHVVSRKGAEPITACGSEFNRDDPEIYQQIVLFVMLVICFIVCHIGKLLGPVSLRFKALFLNIVSGVIFAMVFLPWLIQQFFDVMPWYLNIVIIVLSIFFWLGFPLLRTKASLALVFYFYAFVIRWRVYKGRFFGVDYSEQSFSVSLLIAGFVIWASPFLGMFVNTSIFVFYK